MKLCKAKNKVSFRFCSWAEQTSSGRGVFTSSWRGCQFTLWHHKGILLKHSGLLFLKQRGRQIKYIFSFPALPQNLHFSLQCSRDSATQTLPPLYLNSLSPLILFQERLHLSQSCSLNQRFTCSVVHTDRGQWLTYSGKCKKAWIAVCSVCDHIGVEISSTSHLQLLFLLLFSLRVCTMNPTFCFCVFLSSAFERLRQLFIKQPLGAQND